MMGKSTSCLIGIPGDPINVPGGGIAGGAGLDGLAVDGRGLLVGRGPTGFVGFFVGFGFFVGHLLQ